MKNMPGIVRSFVAAVIMLAAANAQAQLASISNADAASGLRQALTDGAAAAVSKLGVENGFFGDGRVKIPLPSALQRVEGAMRAMGMSRQADELILKMNRAAEEAVPHAKELLVDAARRMTLQDAKGILQGGQTSVTDYFRRSTSTQLAQRFLPIVKIGRAHV